MSAVNTKGAVIIGDSTVTQRAQWNLNKIEITLNGTFAG